MDYEEFLNSKNRTTENSGFEILKEDINSKLYEFQKDIVRWALIKGKSAIFADCGLGKTAMQLEWSNPGDIVLDPFNGIGSSVYMALRMGRRGLGIELKESYYKQSELNADIALEEG